MHVAHSLSTVYAAAHGHVSCQLTRMLREGAMNLGGVRTAKITRVVFSKLAAAEARSRVNHAAGSWISQAHFTSRLLGCDRGLDTARGQTSSHICII